MQVCHTMKQDFYEYDSTGACNGQVVLFYSFHFSGPVTNAITIQPNYPVTGSFVFYGPFDQGGLNSCNQINMNYGANVTGEFDIVTSGGVSSSTAHTLSVQGGYYILMVTLDQCEGTMGIDIHQDTGLICEEEIPCTECVTSFSPTPGKYVVSAWVMEDVNDPTITSYSNTFITISFQGVGTVLQPLEPKGAIIDGWQRIEEVIEIPPGATGIDIQLEVASGEAYFDDIRFFPYDGSMMSYVYDPISLRLMAELDERNYATLYEYDEEGKLIRVKKETEKGIMTIQENRDNIIKN
jgi:hypothetical protein